MPKKRKSIIAWESERRTQTESQRQRIENERLRRKNEKLRREKEDPLAAEKQRRLNAEYYRRRKEILNQMEAEKQSRLAENRRKEIQNQIEAEKQSRLAENRRRLAAERYRAACSEKKEDVSKWQKKQIREDIPVEGRRIVDFLYVFNAIKDVNNHSKAGCNLNDIFIERESIHGICTSYCLKCAVCNFEKDIWSENPSAKRKNLNMEFLSGIMSIKCSFKDANALLSKMRLPLFCEKNPYIPFTTLDSYKTSQNTPQNLRENVQTESQLTAVEQCSFASGNSSLFEQVDLGDLIVEDKFEIEEENVIENINESETIIPDERVRTSDDKLVAGQEQVLTHSNKTCQNISKNLVENGQSIIENKKEPENIILGQRVRTSDDKLIADQEQVILNVTTIKQEINSDDEDLTTSVTNETKSKESKIVNYEQSVFKSVPILSQQNEERACEKRTFVNQGQINLQLIASQEQVITHNSKACQNIPKNSGENMQRESQLTYVEQCSPASGNSSLLQRVDFGGLIIEEQFEIKEENIIENINEFESIILDPRRRTSDDKLIAGQEQVITHNDKTCQNIPKNLEENVQGEKHYSCASGNSSLLERVHLGGLIVEGQFKIKEENVIENINESETIILVQRMRTSDDKLIAGQEQVITHSNKTCQNTPKNLGENVQRESQLTAVKQCSSASGEQVDLGDLIVEDQFEIKEETVIEDLNESESIILGPRMGTSDDKLIASQEQAMLNTTTIKQEINSDDEDLTSSVTNETKSKESKIDNYEQSFLRTVPILSQQNEEVACEKRMIVNQGQINLQNIIENKNEPENIIIGQKVRTSDDKLIADQEQVILNMTTIKQEIISDDEDLTSSVTNETKSKESKIDNYKQSVLRTVPILSQQNEEVACEKIMIVNQGQIHLQNIIENKNEPENIIIGQKVRTSDDKLIADQEQVILNMTTIKQEIISDDEDLTSSVTNETKSKESRVDNYEQSVLVPILSQQNEERACKKRMIVNQEQINLHKNVVIINNQVNNMLVKPDDNTMEIIDVDSMTDFDYKPESELPRKKTRTEIYKDLYNRANMQRTSRTLKKGINMFQNRLNSNGFVTTTSVTTGRRNVTSTSSITSGVTATSSITTRGGGITSLIPVQHSPKSNESSALIVPQMPHNIARETNQGLGGTASISGVPSAIQQPANASAATYERLASTVIKQPVNLSNNVPGAIPAANWQTTSLSNVVSNASGSNICAQQSVKSSNSISRVIPATNIVQNANRNKMCILQPVKSFSNIPRVKTVKNIARKANTRKIHVLQHVKSPNSIPRVKPATKIAKYANGTTYAVL